MFNIQPRGFNDIPLVIKNILIINTLLFFGSLILDSFINFHYYLDLYPMYTEAFQPHQIITYMFMHANFMHLFFNMLGIYIFGVALEAEWGSKRFLNFYLLCGIAAALLQLLISYLNDKSVTVLLGASGALYGLLAAFAMTYPNMTLHIYFIIPIKAKHLLLIYGAYEFITSITANDNIAHVAHLGGLIMGVLILFIWNKNKKSFF